MSAILNPAPSPVKPQPAKAPTRVPVEPKRSRRGLWILLVILAVGAGAAYQFWYKPAQEQKAATPVITYRTAKVVVGPFEKRMRVGGVTSARLYANLTGPMMRSFESRSAMTILTLVKNGSWVKKDVTLATLDAGWLQDHIDDTQATVDQARNDEKKRLAEQEVEKENLRQTLRVSKANVDKARWEAQAAEVRTDIERELLKLNFEEAEARYKQSQLDMPQKEIAHGAELKILNFTTERHIRHVGRHETDLLRYTIRNPMEGLVVLSTTRKGGDMVQLQVGDEMSSGQPLMKVVNPNSMQLEANINQAESLDLRIGQTASVRLDAYPEVELKGKIYSIGALAVGGWRQNYYIRNVPVRVAIEGSHPQLIPDLSASADVLLDRKEDAVIAPLGAVRKDGKQTYVLVKQGAGFERRDIEVEDANALYALVKSGLKEGDEVRLD